jgi:hypothetical protein
MKHVNYLWPPLEATLASSNVNLFFKKTLFGKESIKTRETAIYAKSEAF